MKKLQRLVALLFCAATAYPAAQDVVKTTEVRLSGVQTPGAPVDLSVDQRIATIYKSLVPPRLAADIFGYRISRNYIVIQVTVINESKELDMLIHNVGVQYDKALPKVCKATGVATQVETPNLSDKDKLKDELLRMTTRVLPKPKAISSTVESCESSSHEITLLRGVAEKGQVWDPRNQTFRALQAIATIGGGLTGVAGLGPVLPLAVSAFSGPGISAFQQLFPDMTINQMHRLNDSAFATNTLVPKNQAKIVALFVPVLDFLDDKEVSGFIKNPFPYYTGASGNGALAKLEVAVDYKHIIAVDDIDPVISDIQMSATEQKKLLAGKAASGQIIGRFLDGAEVSLLGDNDKAPKVTRDTSQTSSDNRLFFTMTPSGAVNPTVSWNFQVTKNKKTTSFAKGFDVAPPPPVLTSVTTPSPAQGQQDSDVKVELAGDNFADLSLAIETAGPGASPKGSITAVAGTVTIETRKLTATLHISADAAPGVWTLRVNEGGAKSGAVNFTVTAKQ